MNNLGKPDNLAPKNITLIEGEKVVWTGQPDLKMFRPMDWVAIPFAVIWLGVAISVTVQFILTFGTTQAPKSGGVFCIIWSLFILSIGAYGLVGRFVNEYQLKKRTRFVLTNKRAIVTCNWLKRWEKSCQLAGLEDIEKVVDKNGRGVVIFEDVPQYQLMQWQWNPIPQVKRTKAPVFFDIQSADKVFALAQEISKGGPNQPLNEASIDTPKWRSQSIESLSPERIASGPFAEYLRPDEKLLWQGQPDQNIRIFRKPELMGLMVMIITASVLSILPCVLIHRVFHGTGYLLLAWLGSFALVFLLSLIQEKALRKNIHYAVSDQRIIELMKFSYLQTICKYAEITNLHNMIKSPYDDGTGSIYFTPPAKGLAAALFGQEAMMITNLNPMSRKEPIFLVIDKPDAVVRLIQNVRQKKGLAEISKQGSQARRVPMVANAGLKRIGKERSISPLLVAKMFLFSKQATSAWLGAGILSVFTCVAINMLSSYNWSIILEPLKITKTVTARVHQVKTMNHRYNGAYSCLVEYKTNDEILHQSRFDSPRRINEGDEIEIDYLPFMPGVVLPKASSYYSGGFLEIWVAGVLLMASIGFTFLFRHVLRGWRAINLLKTGIPAQGTRLPDERILLCVNNQPAICERNYEFTVNGNIYPVKSITSVNQPRQKKVTILFDPSNPDHAVVLDDLPGCPIISDDDMSIEYARDRIPDGGRLS